MNKINITKDYSTIEDTAKLVVARMGNLVYFEIRLNPSEEVLAHIKMSIKNAEHIRKAISGIIKEIKKSNGQSR